MSPETSSGMGFGLRCVVGVPTHGSGLDWWVEGRVGVRRVRGRVLAGVALRCGGLAAVVVGSASRVSQHGVGGQDLLQGNVGFSGLLGVLDGAGVGVMLAQERAVGTADVRGTGIGEQSQDGVEICRRLRAHSRGQVT